MGMDWFTWSLLAALIWGVQPSLDKVALASFSNPMAALGIRCIGGAVGMLLIPLLLPSVVSGGGVSSISWKACLTLMVAGFLGSVLGQLAYMQALKLGELSRVPAVTACAPLISFVLAITFLGEPVTAKKIMAIVLVASGVVMMRL